MVSRYRGETGKEIDVLKYKIYSTKFVVKRTLIFPAVSNHLLESVLCSRIFTSKAKRRRGNVRALNFICYGDALKETIISGHVPRN